MSVRKYFIDWCRENDSSLINEWHPTKNDVKYPADYDIGDQDLVWWLGKCGHEWQASIDKRINGTGCPYCAGKKVCIGFNDLQSKNPALADMWHPTKNGTLRPTDVTFGSNKVVWWKGTCGHEWESKVSQMMRSRGCPYCASKRVLVGFNDLATKNSTIAAEWDYEKNGDLKPTDVTVNCNKEAWWKCRNGHSWKTRICTRNRGNGCPYCSHQRTLPGETDLQSLYPDIAAEWHPTKNGDLRPTDVVPGSNKPVWWLGKCGHEWRIKPRARIDGNNCPICANQRRTSFNEKAIAYYLQDHIKIQESVFLPELKKKELDIYIHEYRIAIEYDGYFHKSAKRDIDKTNLCIKNGIKLLRIREPSCPSLVGSICIDMKDKSHKSFDEALIKLIGILEPLIGKKIDTDIDSFRDRIQILDMVERSEKENSIASVSPELIVQWDDSKNGNSTPYNVKAHSNIKYWWKCEKGHEWYASPNERSRDNTGCPYCSGKRVLVGFNDLTTVRPDLAKEWHPDKNGDLRPTDVTLGSNKHIWWRCTKGHEWNVTVNNRSKSNCPYCCGKKAWPGDNDLATLRPDIAQQWHPTKNGTLKASDVTLYCNKTVWWKCDRGHEWEYKISDRISDNCACPYCSHHKVIEGETDLQTVNPELARQWDYDKNGELLPGKVQSQSNKTVWWKCDRGHEWTAKISDRARGNGCPYCSNQKILIGYNDLQTTFPEIAAQWHPTKNGDLKPTQITAGNSKKSIWWMCEHGHEWKTAPYNRTHGKNGCPVCKSKKSSSTIRH